MQLRITPNGVVSLQLFGKLKLAVLVRDRHLALPLGELAREQRD